MNLSRWLLALIVALTLATASSAQTPGLTALVLAQLFGHDCCETSAPPPSERVADGHVNATPGSEEEAEECPRHLIRTRIELLKVRPTAVRQCAATVECSKDCAQDRACCKEAPKCTPDCCTNIECAGCPVIAEKAKSKDCACAKECGCCKGGCGKDAVEPKQVLHFPRCAEDVLKMLNLRVASCDQTLMLPPPAPMPYAFPYPVAMPSFACEEPCVMPLPAQMQQLLEQRQHVRSAIERIELELVRLHQKRQHEQAETHVSTSSAHAHLVTEAFEAHCTRVTCLGKSDRILLDGDVTLVWKKNGQNLRIKAQRIVVNTRDDSFFVDSSASEERTSQFGAQRRAYPQPPLVPAGYYVPASPYQMPVD